jgi:periplasmic protein TonB
MFAQVVMAVALAGSSSASAPAPMEDFHQAVEAARTHPGPNDFVTRPDWIMRPDGDDVLRVYPARALSSRLAGRARIICRISDQGRLGPCEVISETPAGLGFGDAAVQIASRFRMRPVEWSTRLSVANRMIVIPLSFTPPQQ